MYYFILFCIHSKYIYIYIFCFRIHKIKLVCMIILNMLLVKFMARVKKVFPGVHVLTENIKSTAGGDGFSGIVAIVCAFVTSKDHTAIATSTCGLCKLTSTQTCECGAPSGRFLVSGCTALHFSLSRFAQYISNNNAVAMKMYTNYSDLLIYYFHLYRISVIPSPEMCFFKTSNLLRNHEDVLY